MLRRALFLRTPRFYSTPPPLRESTSWSRYAKRSPITWRSLLVTAAIAGGGLWYLQKEKKDIDDLRARRELERQDTTYGKAKVGGPFTLTDCRTGKVVTEQDFKGRFMILYFGFTNCPDVCPDELEKMSKAISKLDALPDNIGDMVTPVFISVDPGRDTPEAVKEYVQEFHQRFVGLTGTPDQVDKVAKAYRVYVSRGDATDPEGNDYLVDHSIFFFLMDPDGNFMDFFGRTATSDEVAAKLEKRVREWRRDKTSGRL